MPKISNWTHNYNIDKVRGYFEVSIMYRSSLGFYIKLPSQYIADAEALSMTVKGLQEVNFGSAYQPKKEWIIVSSSEELVKQLFSNAIYTILSDTLKKRNVIIVVSSTGATHYHGFDFNHEHPLIGLSFGLTYAIETKTSETNKVYQIPGKYDTLQMYGNGFKVVDDTPENRAFLEHLYMNLNNLKTALNTFGENAESIQQFISSNQKLIG